jgi:hypothetical protein
VPRRALVLALGSAVGTFGSILVLSCWHALAISWIAVSLGALCFAFELPRMQRLWRRWGGRPRAGRAVLIGFVLLSFGVAVGSASIVVPALHGTVSAHEDGGYLVVVTSKGTALRIANPVGSSPPPVGQQVVKPRWSTAFYSGASQVSPTSIMLYVQVAVLGLFCSILIAFAMMFRERDG